MVNMTRWYLNTLQHIVVRYLLHTPLPNTKCSEVIPNKIWLIFWTSGRDTTDCSVFRKLLQQFKATYLLLLPLPLQQISWFDVTVQSDQLSEPDCHLTASHCKSVSTVCTYVIVWFWRVATKCLSAPRFALGSAAGQAVGPLPDAAH